MLSPAVRPALSERLLVGPGTGLLRFNASLGTCYPVAGITAYGRPTCLASLHFRIDPVALLAAPEPPEADAEGDSEDDAQAFIERQCSLMLLAMALLLAVLFLLHAYEPAPAPAAPTYGRAAWHWSDYLN